MGGLTTPKKDEGAGYIPPSPDFEPKKGLSRKNDLESCYMPPRPSRGGVVGTKAPGPGPCEGRGKAVRVAHLEVNIWGLV